MKKKIIIVDSVWEEALGRSWLHLEEIDFRDSLIRIDQREHHLQNIMKSYCQKLTHLIITGNQYSWMSDTLKSISGNVINFSIAMNVGYRISYLNLDRIIKSMKKLKFFSIITEHEYCTNILDAHFQLM